MPGIIGFIGKDLVSIKCVLSIEEEAIARTASKFGGWGVIYYQSGDVLLRSHPFSEGDPAGLLQVLGEAETSIMLGRFESSAAPPPGKWNAQPFRYRGWIYVQHGRIEGFSRIRESIVGAMPDFLGRSLKGTSDAEGVFHLILSFLFDAGKLDAKEIEPQTIARAMKHSLAFVRKMCSEHDCGESSISMLLSNGMMLAGYNASQDGMIAVYEGRGRCDRCDFAEKCMLLRHSQSSRAALVMMLSHFPESFQSKHFLPVTPDSFFYITRDVTVETIPGRSSLI
jgi:hypothetical protein